MSRSFLWKAALLVMMTIELPTLATAAEDAPSNVVGYWLGALEAGPQKLRLQLDVTKDGDTYHCKLDSLDQQAFGIACANVTFEAPTFSFDIPAVNGHWRGTLSSDGKQLAGTWTQGMSLPLSLSRQETLVAAPARTAPEFLPAMAPVKARDVQQVLAKDLEASLRSGKLAADKGVGVAIGVIGDGESYVFAFGGAQPDSLFEIGSITKTFTGLALAQLTEQGRVQPQEPVRELLPISESFKPVENEITLLDLVTQHSGLPRLPTNLALTNLENPYLQYRPAHLYAFLRGQGFGKPKTSDFLYSNLGFGLLGHALANHEQQTYEAMVEKLITEPLCMHDTFVTPSDEQRKRFIRGRQADFSPASTWEFDALAGAGALRSSAGDMLKYLAAQLNLKSGCQTTSPSAKSMAAGLKRTHELQATAGPGMKIGYGWLYVEQTASYWHNGGTGGYSSFAFFNPKSGTAAVVLTNLAIGQSGSFADRIGQHIGQRFAGVPAVEID